MHSNLIELACIQKHLNIYKIGNGCNSLDSWMIALPRDNSYLAKYLFNIC